VTKSYEPRAHTFDEARRRIDNSIISLRSLLSGAVAPEHIEAAFSDHGCGAVLIELNKQWNATYNRYYFLQWRLGHRDFKNDQDRSRVIKQFNTLDLPLRLLLCSCAVAVARSRSGTAGQTKILEDDLARFGCDSPLKFNTGRPLAANRSEFHPSVDWLIEQERFRTIQKDRDPAFAVVGYAFDGSAIVGRSQADEARLLTLYREWKDSTAEGQRSDGNKFNGDIYYGAFRGRMHVDCGKTMTALFGPGELRDRSGNAPGLDAGRNLGGTLMVGVKGEQEVTQLPLRLPNGSAYVVVFFEKPSRVPLASRALVNRIDFGWEPTLHGVQRILDTGFSRGQAVLHVGLLRDDLARPLS
jgi:hypothetical protein